jgi:4,5-DOPA dioxygenase extradiol
MSLLTPSIFFGHGNPMNAIATNAYTEAWRAIGRSMPRPKAILCVSAHWYAQGAAVTVSMAPRTIHDFGGFPPELYEVEYPAPGDPVLAHRVRELLAPVPVSLDSQWGLDHGAWSVLCHVFPGADVPIVQLRIDRTQPPGFHYEMGRRLAPLREEGVLIAGSGNLVHNLREYDWEGRGGGPYDWAMRFQAQARELILAGDHAALVQYEGLGSDAMRSIPTPEHYLPLLYVLGAQRHGEDVAFPVEGVDGGSISMLAVQIGAALRPA